MDETYADLVHYQIELEQKNSALEDAQRFIASVLASMTDVLIVCDVDGRVQQVNQALEELVGRTEAELRGSSFLELMAPASRAEAEVRYRERLLRYCEAVDASDLPAELMALKQELRIEPLLADLEPLIKGTLEGAERVRDIVQDLKRFSSGQQDAFTEFDLVHVIETAVHWVTKGSRRDLVRVMELPERLSVTGHPGQLHQVIMNLVQNALDAMQDRDSARLEVAPGRDESCC